MKKHFLILLAFTLVSCAKSPLRVEREPRFVDSYWGGLNRRVVTQSNLATDGAWFYFGTRHGHLLALDASTGKKQWRLKLKNGAIDTTPLVHGEDLYIGTSNGRLMAMDKKTGKEKWHHDVLGEILGQATVFKEGTLLFGANDGALYAVRTSDGSLLWRFKGPPVERMTIHGFATPASSGDEVYAAFADGTVVALDGHTGRELWNQRVSSGERFPDIVAPLLLSEQRILAAQFGGKLVILGPKGGIRWSFDKGGSSASAIAYKTHFLVPAGDGKVFSMDATTGEKLWTYESNKVASWSGIALLENLVLAASHEGLLHVLDAETGKFLWHYDVGAPIIGPPLIRDERAWLITKKGALFALMRRG